MTVLTLTTFAELLKHEQEIVDRISRIPHGGRLFLANPLQCITDTGVELTAELRAELVRDNPSLGALSMLAYEAIKQQPASESRATARPVSKENSMSLMAGYDFVLEISPATLDWMIKTNITLPNNQRGRALYFPGPDRRGTSP